MQSLGKAEIHGRGIKVDKPQGAEMDLNTKSLPKQKTIKSLIYRTQGFQITINENPPTWEIFFNKFWLSRAGIEPGTLGLEV